jgi:hypothetical protein
VSGPIDGTTGLDQTTFASTDNGNISQESVVKFGERVFNSHSESGHRAMAAVISGQRNDSHLAQILAIETLVVVIAIISVTLRLYVRIKLIKSIGGDDWSIAGAAVRRFPKKFLTSLYTVHFSKRSDANCIEGVHK